MKKSLGHVLSEVQGDLGTGGGGGGDHYTHIGDTGNNWDDDDSWVIAVNKLGRQGKARVTSSFQVGENVFRSRMDSYSNKRLKAFCDGGNK